ncbi:unnamed protein product [Clonostachys rosea]|uniref:Uncharacterized protein n=1 Tax=Bionectria ochroleuca TaxID=29856 RepID=A0ABY6UTG8_BIOOC|nr:unnamed protein product [Clonostachys rosea]
MKRSWENDDERSQDDDQINTHIDQSQLSSKPALCKGPFQSIPIQKQSDTYLQRYIIVEPAQARN